MDIYETLEFLETKLKEGIELPADLYGYNVSIDPYCNLSELFPVVLLEAERTEISNRAEYGTPAQQDHVISATVIREVQKNDFKANKKLVNEGVKKVIEKLFAFNDYRISKLILTGFAHDEIIIGSVKCTAVAMEIKVRTNWSD